MERTTVYLDAELKRRLKTAAAQGHRSEAAMIREALEQYLATEPVPTLLPVGNSTDGGIADRVDTELGELGFGQASARDPK